MTESDISMELDTVNLEHTLLAVWTKYRLPFVLADDLLFNSLLKESAQEFLSSYKIRMKILDLAEEIRSNLVELFVESLVDAVLIMYLWSSKKKKSFLGIALSFITNDWELWTNVIAVPEVLLLSKYNELNFN